MGLTNFAIIFALHTTELIDSRINRTDMPQPRRRSGHRSRTMAGLKLAIWHREIRAACARTPVATSTTNHEIGTGLVKVRYWLRDLMPLLGTFSPNDFLAPASVKPDKKHHCQPHADQSWCRGLRHSLRVKCQIIPLVGAGGCGGLTIAN